MAIIEKQLAPSVAEPPLGTVMCYGMDCASPTKWGHVPEPWTSTVFDAVGMGGDRTVWRPREHISQFGRLLEMLPGRVCRLDTTPEPNVK